MRIQTWHLFMVQFHTTSIKETYIKQSEVSKNRRFHRMKEENSIYRKTEYRHTGNHNVIRKEDAKVRKDIMEDETKTQATHSLSISHHKLLV